MKIIEFNEFFFVLKEMEELPKKPSSSPTKPTVKAENTEVKPKLTPTAPEKSHEPSFSPKNRLRDAEEFAMPDSFLKSANISGDMELEILSNAMVLTNRNMTVLELLNALESLEEKCRDYYRCLVENFMDEVSDTGCDCTFCEMCMATNGSFPEFLRVIQENTPMDKGIIPDLGCVSEEMVERLHDMGLCLNEINFSIMEEEVVYFGKPKS